MISNCLFSFLLCLVIFLGCIFMFDIFIIFLFFSFRIHFFLETFIFLCIFISILTRVLTFACFVHLIIHSVNERNRELARAGHLMTEHQQAGQSHFNFLKFAANLSARIFSRRSSSLMRCPQSQSTKICPAPYEKNSFDVEKQDSMKSIGSNNQRIRVSRSSEKLHLSNEHSSLHMIL